MDMEPVGWEVVRGLYQICHVSLCTSARLAHHAWPHTAGPVTADLRRSLAWLDWLSTISLLLTRRHMASFCPSPLSASSSQLWHACGFLFGGGWVYSQVGADRYVARLEDFWMLLGLSILVEPSTEDDFVEASRLVASMDDRVIGDATLAWKLPNRGGAFHSGSMIYEWMQDIDLRPRTDGLIKIEIRVKLNSQRDFLRVNGHAFVHITERDTNEQQLSVAEYLAKKSAGTHLSQSKRHW